MTFIPADMLRFAYTDDTQANVDTDGLSTSSFQMIFLCLFVRVMQLANLLTFSHVNATLPQPYAMCFLELLGSGTIPLRPPREDSGRTAVLLLGQRCFDCAMTVLVQRNCFFVLCSSSSSSSSTPSADITWDLLNGLLLKAKGSSGASQVESARTLARSVLNLLSTGLYGTSDVNAQLLQVRCMYVYICSGLIDQIYYWFLLRIVAQFCHFYVTLP